MCSNWKMWALGTMGFFLQLELVEEFRLMVTLGASDWVLLGSVLRRLPWSPVKMKKSQT